MPNFYLEMGVAMLGAFLGSQIPEREGRNLAYPWMTVSTPSPRPPVALDTDMYQHASQYESGSDFFLPLATETTFPSDILPAVTESDAATIAPSIDNLPETVILPELEDDAETVIFPELEDDDEETQSSQLKWLIDPFFAVTNILLAIFMTFGQSTNLLGFLLQHHRQVFVAIGRKNRALREKIAALQASPVLFPIPQPTSDEGLDEPAHTASASTQTGAATCTSLGTQTEAAICSSLSTQTEAAPCCSVGMQTEAAAGSSVGTQTEAAAGSSVGTQTEAAAGPSKGTQTEAAPYSSVGTQTGDTDSASVWTQTDAVQYESVGTQTTPDAAPEDSAQVTELRATLAKQRQDSDVMIRGLQASLARLGSENSQMRAQLLRTQRLPVASPSPGGMPTYGGLAYDPHHNPNPEANAQQLAQNQAMQQQQRLFQQQSPRWQPSPGRQGRGQ